MQFDLQSTVAALTGAMILIKLWAMDRKTGRADGQRDEIIKGFGARLDGHDIRFEAHAVRISSIERTRFLTHDEHRDESEHCRREIDRRLNANDTQMLAIFNSLSSIEKTVATIKGRMERGRTDDE